MKHFSNHQALKNKIIREMKLYFTYTCFLTLVLSVFVTYQKLLLKEYVHLNFHYGYSFFEALILAKVILVGESLKLGERFSDKPLIYPVSCKTILFCILLFIFGIVERLIEKLLFSTKIEKFSQVITLNTIDILLAKTLVMLFVFFLFFSFLELGRVLGEGELFRLFFKSRKR